MVEKVIKDGMVAVLYSPGYGAGWSTWNSEYAELLTFDKVFVDAVEAGEKDIDAIAEARTGDEWVYTGGWKQIQVAWIPEGTRFFIDEYDGNESIQIMDQIGYTA